MFSEADAAPGNRIIGLLDRLPAHQAIVVTGAAGFRAELATYERTAGHWRPLDKMPACIGRNGMGKTGEGDLKSPVGMFTLGRAFGIDPPPDGLRYPYRPVTGQDYWIDDSGSSLYNRWVRFKNGYWRDWRSAEALFREEICYRHAAVINYNAARQPGKGSAIFLHVWRGEDCPTHGCTAVSAPNLIRILQWLDFEKNPVILQGDLAELAACLQTENNRPYWLAEGLNPVTDLIPDLFCETCDANAAAAPGPPDFISRRTALTLAKVQQSLTATDYSLKLLKPAFYRNEADSRGWNDSVAVTLVDLRTGAEPDMGEKPLKIAGGYRESDFTPAQNENRHLLRQVMEKGGFKAKGDAWWQFKIGEHDNP